VYTNVNGRFLITDQYTWYEVFKVDESLASLNVLLTGNNRNSPLEEYKVNCYDLPYQLLDTKLADNKGVTTWSGIRAGNYLLERYHTALNSLWENDLYEGGKQVNVITGKTDTVIIDQTEPFIESVTVNGTVFGPGSTVHTAVRVTNPSTVTKTCQATIRIDLDQQSSYDFNPGFQNSMTIQPGQSEVFGFDWTIPLNAAPGTYSIASCIQTQFDSNWRYTDATNWNPLIKMENNTISQIQWSGLTWNVKSGTALGPGPNDWMANSSSVWVDGEGNLHLKIRKEGNNWYCAAISTKPLSGYGSYTFQVATDVEKLDKNVVLGLFNYETDTREIDIEFSRWGNAAEKAGWYNVQPSTPASHYSFSLHLEDDYSTHKYQWSPSKIFFQSYRGHSEYLPEKDSLISQWTYTGSQIPPAGNERVIINLWLFKGVPPSDMKESEVVIKSFSFNKVGDLSIQVNDINQTSVVFPASKAVVQLYNADNKLISTQPSALNGSVLFNGLNTGSGYYYRVFNQPNNPAFTGGKEYWGTKSGIQVMDGQTTTSIFTREQPISGTVKVYNGAKKVTGQTVEPGVPLKIEQTIINPSPEEQLVRGVIKLDTDSIEPFDFNLTHKSLVSVPANSSVIQQWTILPIKKGSYYFAGAVQTVLNNDTINSDKTSWSHLPLFSISPPVAGFSMNTTSGCAPLTVEFTDNSNFFPASWAWDMNNDGIVDDTTQHAAYTFLEAGTYFVKLIVSNSAGSDSVIKTITVDPVLQPQIEITAFPSGKINEGTLVTFTAAATNGGTHPTFEWLVDGIVKNNTPVFATNELTNGQKVSCSLSSHAPCADPNTVSSNVIVMEITPINKIPVAHAGMDQWVNEGTLVTLDGTGSYDLDQQPITYSWTAPAGIILTAATSSQPTFTAPKVKKDTLLNFTLTINDGLANSYASSVNIHVKDVQNTSGEDKDQDKLIIYPNPTMGILCIEGLNAYVDTVISIYTSDGSLIDKKINHSATCTIDLSRQIPGIYLLVINNRKIKIIRESF
jgi:PKD repeat protein